MWRLEPSQGSFTFGPYPRKQPIVTTKPSRPIRGGTCLKIIPLHMVTLTIPIEVIFELVNAPSFVVSSKLETLKFLSITIILTPPHRLGDYFNFQHTSCIRGIYNVYNNL
jgi:hypothetical protein